MNNPKTNNTNDIRETLQIDSNKGKGSKIKRLVIFFLLGLVIILSVFKWGISRNGNTFEYKTAEAVRGDFTLIVNATGNLEPINQVDVGSEVSGTVESVMVDYNDNVKEGEILAKLDTTRIEAQANQSRAVVAKARANLQQVRATLFEARKEMDRFIQVQKISHGKVPSRHEFDAADAALRRAKASEAMVLANIAEARARLKVNETDLEKSIIISPINGVVLERSVEPGQTVAASLQAPILFTLAEDLTKMELQVEVDEADVGQVKKGQNATFTVDAFPKRIYPARITQVRYGSKTSAGVVTYPALLDVDNSDLSLRPGMTATADIVVKHVKDALLVPNSALHFVPPRPETEMKEEMAGGSLLSKLFPRPKDNTKKKKQESEHDKKQQVWTLVNNEPVAVSVATGATNDIMTEISNGDIKPGTPVIIEAISKKR